MNDFLMTLCTVVGALGGFEFVKWWYHRKARTEVEKAEAESAKIKADADEFRYLRERIEMLDKDSLAKEQRFNDQITHIRDLNRQIVAIEIEKGDLKAEISALRAERKMKLCERRGCSQREPQSGY
jgi:chromosome segregation ATPase